MSASFSQGCCYNSPTLKSLHTKCLWEKQTKNRPQQGPPSVTASIFPSPRTNGKRRSTIINHSSFSLSVCCVFSSQRLSLTLLWHVELSPATEHMPSLRPQQDILPWMLAPPDESHSPFHTSHGMSPIFQVIWRLDDYVPKHRYRQRPGQSHKACLHSVTFQSALYLIIAHKCISTLQQCFFLSFKSCDTTSPAVHWLHLFLFLPSSSSLATVHQLPSV